MKPTREQIQAELDRRYKEQNEPVLQELARRDFVDYCKYVIPGWKEGRHLKLICNELDLIMQDLINYQILIITVPPQHGKSQTVTETYPSYYLGKIPTRRVVEVSYGDDLAQRFGRRNREKIEQYGQSLFNIQVSSRTRSDTDFELNNHIGSMISRGIMAGITGQPADLIIIDDPIKNQLEADSKTYRDRIWDEFEHSIFTRLSAKGKIILIQTRWHEDDLAGRLLNPEYHFADKVKLLNIPCEAEENDILGRHEGGALFPEIGKDDVWLADTKKSLNTRTWLAMYQGRPTSAEGNMLKRTWWKWYKELPELPIKIMSVDATFKDNEKNDFVSIQVWGKTGPDMYLIDRHKAHMDFPTTMQAIKNMKTRHKDIRGIYIEDKANGSAIIQVLRKNIGGIIPVEPYGSKEARVSAVSPFIEAGNAYLPSEAQWINDFVEECSSFPNGAHDDDVDAMSQALNRLKDYVAQGPQPPQHYNFPSEKPYVNPMLGGELDRSYIDYNGGY